MAPPTTTNRRENVEQRRQQQRRACLSGNPMNRKANAMPQRIPGSAPPPLLLSPRSSFTITTNSFECRCRIGNILVANSNVRLCVRRPCRPAGRCGGQKGLPVSPFACLCTKKKNNHKKGHQRLIEKSLVRLRLPLSRPQTTPVPVITSPVARRSHQLALEAVALIAFAQPGQARPARQPSFPLLSLMLSPWYTQTLRHSIATY